MKQLVPFVAPLTKAVTLANAVQEYLATRFQGKAFKTRLRSQFVLEEFEIFVGNKQINRETFIKWDEAQMKRGIAASTINKKATILKAFLRWCELNEFIAKAPVTAVITHQEKKKPLPQIYTDDEYERIKEFTKGTHLYYMTVVGRNTGLSMVDVCHLRWACVDLDDLFIRTNRIKLAWRGIDICHIPIIANSDLHLMLQELQGQKIVRYNNENDDYVHHEAQGRYAYKMEFLVMEYRSMLKKLGITGKTFKNWRNTFISMLANSNANLALACKISGHKDPSIFAAYVRPDKESLRSTLQSAFQWQEGKETVKQLRTPKGN